MEYTYSNKLFFKPIEKKIIDRYLEKVKRIKLNDNNHIVQGLFIDSEKLNYNDVSLINDGDILPQYLNYWLDIVNNINNNCLKNKFSTFWINRGEIYGSDLGECCGFMLDKQTWENTESQLLFCWTEKAATKSNKVIPVKGYLLPIYLGIIAVLDSQDNNELSIYF